MDARTSRYPEIYARAERDPEGFWGEAAQAIDWTEAPKTIFDPKAGIYGRWFTDADDDAFAPMLVVNETMLHQLGATSVAQHPTVLLGSDDRVRATIIGVVPDRWANEPASAFLLYDQLKRWLGGLQPTGKVAAVGPQGYAIARPLPLDDILGAVRYPAADAGRRLAKTA